jgi:lipid II:glycine glycyltransferase (peptidoglycan interpeptide bridge formation enzyme)
MTESVSISTPSGPVVNASSVATISSLQAEVDQVTQTEWSRWLEQFEDANLYQTWAYGEVRWGRSQLSHLVLKRGGQPVAMAQLRIVRPMGFGFGIAYLRWGPVCELKGAGIQPEILAAMARALRAEYVERRGLFLRILPNVCQGTSRAMAFTAAFADFQVEPFGPGDSYRTILLDLSMPLEELRKKLDGKWRNQLNRAEKNGLTIIEGSGEAEFTTMIALFNEMWQRKQFAVASDINEFRRVQQSLPDRQKMRVFICLKDGVPMSGLLGTGMGDCGIYLFGGTSDEGMKQKGSYLLQWRMIQWLKESGVRFYNLGGINPITNPGVYHFKQGMNGLDSLYLEPRVACSNPLSKMFVGAGLKLRGGLRRKLRRLLRPAAGQPASNDKSQA